MPPATPSSNPTPPPKNPPVETSKRSRFSWIALKSRANTTASIVALFIFLLGVGVIGGYFYAKSRGVPPSKNKQPTIETLSPSELNQLGSIGSDLGGSGQVLDIGASTLFRQGVNVGGNLAITGQLSATGPARLSQLSVTGPTGVAALTVSGPATLQNSLTVAGLVTFNGGLTVAGATSLNALNVDSISVRSIAISGPLTIGHLISQGPSPTLVSGQDGSGGTASISGNDTAGQININTGSGPGNLLAAITFRASYSASVHVQLTPLTPGAAAAQAYVTRSNTGFEVYANTPPSGQTLSFDYLVTQ